MGEEDIPRSRIEALVRGLPGHPLHPPLTDATIGMFVFATAAAVVGFAGAIEDKTGPASWLALITWVVTAGGGFVMLGLWLQGGGMRQSGQSGAVIRPPLILGHFALAATGLVLWIIYVATDTDALAWIAFALLAVVAVLGFTMLAIWLQQRRAAPSAAAPAGMSPATGGAAPATAGAGPAPGPGPAP